MATPAPPAALPRRHYFLTAALATLLFLPGIFTKDFLLFNEGRRAIIGLELYQRHEWLVPRLMGEPILTKPPFFYWLEVISYKVFHGSSDWAARIPSVIAAVAGLLAFLRLTAVLLGVEAALFGTAVLATSPIYFAMAQSAEPEMVFVALGTLGLASAIPPLLTNRPSSGAIIIALFFVGLSFFTKGPFVPVSVVLALLGWMILAGKIRAVSPLAWIVGTVLAALPTLLWAFGLRSSGYSFASLLSEAGEHLDSDAPHAQPLLWYFSHMDTLMFPWSLIIPFGIGYGGWASWRRVKRDHERMAGVLGNYFFGEEASRSLIALWFAFSMIVISVVSSKRYYYGLIFTPSAAAICAMIYRDVLSGLASSETHPTSKQQSLRFICGILGITILGVAVFMPQSKPWAELSGEDLLPPKILTALAGVLLIGLAAAMFFRGGFTSWRNMVRDALVGIGIGMFFVGATYNFALNAKVNDHYSLKGAAAEIAKLIPPGATVFTINGDSTIWFYLGRPNIPVLVKIEDIRKFAADHPGALGTCYRKNLDKASKAMDFTILCTTEYIKTTRAQVFLIRIDAAK